MRPLASLVVLLDLGRRQRAPVARDFVDDAVERILADVIRQRADGEGSVPGAPACSLRPGLDAVDEEALGRPVEAVDDVVPRVRRRRPRREEVGTRELREQLAVGGAPEKPVRVVVAEESAVAVQRDRAGSARIDPDLECERARKSQVRDCDGVV